MKLEASFEPERAQIAVYELKAFFKLIGYKGLPGAGKARRGVFNADASNFLQHHRIIMGTEHRPQPRSRNEDIIQLARL